MIESANTTFAPSRLTQLDLLNTLGTSPTITVSDLEPLGPNNWAVDVTVDTIEQAICVAFITQSFYRYYDNSTLMVRFYAADCNQRIPSIDQSRWNTKRLLANIYNRALQNNPYYAFISKDPPDPEFNNQMFVYLTPNVVQYYCDNSADLFGYCHSTAAQAFERVLYNQFFGYITVNYNTNVVTNG